MTEPTTRALRHRPRLIVNTGQGKGKSTAGFGIALRGWAQGWPVAVFQFIKSAKWRTGEKLALETLGRAHTEWGVGGPVEWHVQGQGWTWLRATRDVDQRAIAREGWDEVVRRLDAEQHTLYVLDEFNHVLNRGWVSAEEFLDVMARRPGFQHVIITGRGCPDEVIAAADLATDMTKLRHPFDNGEPGQAGIEW